MVLYSENRSSTFISFSSPSSFLNGQSHTSAHVLNYGISSSFLSPFFTNFCFVCAIPSFFYSNLYCSTRKTVRLVVDIHAAEKNTSCVVLSPAIHVSDNDCMIIVFNTPFLDTSLKTFSSVASFSELAANSTLSKSASASSTSNVF